MDGRSLTLTRPDLAADNLAFFRWGNIAGRVIVTNDAGDWAVLSEDEFTALLSGAIVEGHPLFQDLQRKGLLRDGLDLDGLAARVAQRSRHVRRGPHLHVVTLTRRRGSGSANGQVETVSASDMSVETAEQVVDLALQTASPSLTFELQAQGGEPLLNFEVLRHLVETANTRSKRSAGKRLRFRVLTNFTAMSEEAAEWLLANEVMVSTTLDGPAALHDANRATFGGSAHADVVRWIEYFKRRYAELGHAEDGYVDARLRVTRATLQAGREVVDEYVARGLRTIHLRPLLAARFDADTWARIGYSLEEYLDFYRSTLEYILGLNRRGVDLAESMAAIIATKILTGDDPGIVDLQSPNGAGTGELAYDVDGRVFPNDEARLVDAAGDEIFALGAARHLSVSGILRHPTVRAIAAASLLDAQPMCADCWNKPFCGFSPVRNFITQGDLFGERPHCFECKEHMAVSTRLIELLTDQGDAGAKDILQGWTTTRSSEASDSRVVKEAP